MAELPKYNTNTTKSMKIIRRLGPDPHADGKQSIGAKGCPDILELESGDFLIIGADVTDAATAHLPASVGCGPDERIVRIPRETLLLARKDIPVSA